jgi:acyl-Coa thioesterase superfamily protein
VPAHEPLHPSPDEALPFQFPFFHHPVGYHTAVETRLARGAVGSGRAAAWMRLRVPLVLGEGPSPAQRVLVAADSGSGVGAAWNPGCFVPFVNADLTVSLHRFPDGDWIGLDAATTLEHHGIGLTRTGLYDMRGAIGEGAQSLVVGQPVAR